MMASRLRILAIAACALQALATPKTPRLIWNATASAPTGLYWVQHPDPLQLGDLALARLPLSVQDFAAQRGYLPRGVPLVKHVAALAGDRVCGDGIVLTRNGLVLALRFARDHLRRPLPLWNGCRTLRASDVLLVNDTVARSFDGRYFGSVDRAAILGTLVPLWTH